MSDFRKDRPTLIDILLLVIRMSSSSFCIIIHSLCRAKEWLSWSFSPSLDNCRDHPCALDDHPRRQTSPWSCWSTSPTMGQRSMLFSNWSLGNLRGRVEHPWITTSGIVVSCVNHWYVSCIPSRFHYWMHQDCIHLNRNGRSIDWLQFQLILPGFKAV